MITLLVMGRDHYTPSNLVAHRNLSGWSNPTGWLLSITLGEYSFSATGTVVHLAEEVERPRRGIPRAMYALIYPSLSLSVLPISHPSPSSSP
jgi:amino acid transporter